MRRLILLFVVGAFLSIAGFAAADSTPGTTTTTTTTTTTVSTPTTASTTTTTIPSTTTTTTTGSTTTGTTTTATSTTGGGAPDHKGRHLHWLAGSVGGVGGSSLTLGVLWTGPTDGSLNGQTLTLSVPTAARISQGPHHRAIALAAIQNGDLVSVRAAGDDPSGLTAAAIHVFCNCHWIGGTIGAVNGSSFTVNVGKTGPYDGVLNGTTVTLQVNPDTVYLRGPHRRRLGLGDLTPGECVGVIFSATGFFKAPGFDPSTATFTAKRVHVWGQGSVPQASTDVSSAAQVSQ